MVIAKMDMKSGLPPESPERRTRQRFLALRRGEPCFWASVAGRRVALVDLSIEGFAFVGPATTATEPFAVVLHRAGVPDEIHARASVVNVGGSGDDALLGCRFTSLGNAEAALLQDWLVAHVIMNATVRITEKDAIAIVRGGSLI